MSGWKTVGVKKFNLERIPKRGEIKDIIASYPWLESSAIAVLTRHSFVSRELGKGAFGSAYLMESERDSRYVLKAELGDLDRFPVWEAMVGAYVFAPQKNVEWRERIRVPLANLEDVLAEGQKRELKIGDPFLHVADYYGVVTVDHSRLANFATRIAKEAGRGFTFEERGWGSILDRADEYLLAGLKNEGKNLWQATKFAKNHPMVFSIMEYFEEGNIFQYLLRSEASFPAKLHAIRVAFFQIAETLKVLSRELGFSHGDTHTGNVFVRKLPLDAYSKMWYRTDDPSKSYRVSVPPVYGISFALGDLGLNEIFDYPDRPYFAAPVRSPRHDLHLLSVSFLMLASELAKKEKGPLLPEFVNLARDLEGFRVTSEEYDRIAPDESPLHSKERIGSLLKASPSIDVFADKGKAEDYPAALLAFSSFPDARSFDFDLGDVPEEVYDRQRAFAEKIAEIADTPEVPFEAPDKTKKEFWRNVGKSSGLRKDEGEGALEF